MKNKWTLNYPPDQEKVKQLSADINVDENIAELLVRRGVETFSEAKKFFRPNLDDLHDPFLMKDMDKAVNRLTEAFSKSEKIMVFGDYDVDGTTSVALVFSFLQKQGIESLFYLPDRYKEGYGISYMGIDAAIEEGCSLMIALDLGIRAVDKVVYAKEKGLDIIICDHHKPGNEIPSASAVLDPQREDCSYPYKGLSGCGVGFKLLQGFCIQNDIPQDDLFLNLDLLCISIGADIVPITGENRVLAYFGLKEINKMGRTGIAALLKQSKFSKRELDITDVVFILAPRINAAGRLKSARDAVKLLIAPDIESAGILSQEIEEINTNRKEIDRAIVTEALVMVEENDWFKKSMSTVLYGKGWHKGVIGIVASRLIENQYKPTIVLTENDGLMTGSARSIEGVDIHAALEKCSEYLEQFGGHTMAAGMTLKAENFDAFQKKFDELVREELKEEDLVPIIKVDQILDLKDINQKYYNVLKQFAPFGPGNMRPVLMTKNVVNAKWSKTVGADNSHLKLHIKQLDIPSPEFNGIGFKLGKYIGILLNGDALDMVYSIEENEWNGNVSLQLNVKDLRKAE